MRALWLVNQLWFIVPVNPRSSELLYNSNKPQVFYGLFNNYSPKAKWILVNIPRDEDEGNIHQYSRAWGE